jgi:predicted nucleotidyltransferase
MIVSRDNTERTGLAEQVEHLARRFHLADVYVFGSRAREIAALVRGSRAALQKSSSDVDIGIRPQQGLNLSPSEIVAIAIQLEDIFNVFRVDLVLLPEADPFLALDVIRGELLYAEEPVDQARYELFVLRRAGDLLPLKRERIEMILTSRGR